MTKYTYTPRRRMANSEAGYITTLKTLGIVGAVVAGFCFCMYSQSKFYDSIAKPKPTREISSTNNLEEVLNEH